MKVQYIGHSGFLVTLESCCLLFDYYNGELPRFSAADVENKPIYVFSSHRHEDHFNPAIFSLAKTSMQVKYLLSYDIKLNTHFFKKYPEAATLQEQGRLYSLRMDEHYVIDNLEIDPLKSTDEGVAFLVRIMPEKKMIYHAGDLNWWVWPDDTKQEYNLMTSMFQRAVSQLKELIEANSFDGSIDAAFIPLDPRQEQYEFYGMEYYLKHVPVKNVFPMHFWDQYEIIPRYMEAHKEQGLEGQCSNIIKITKRGECYEV